jgi:hypothetical protein
MKNKIHISAVDPIAPAWDHMVRILFKPFAFKKWLALGFCAFLAQCSTQGGGNASQVWSGPFNQTNFTDGNAWIDSNFNFFITIVVSSIVVLVLLGLLVTWISSRGKFMLIDGIVKNRSAISEPWTEYKTEGNSLFLFSIALGVLLLFVFVLMGGVTFLIALPDLQSEQFTVAGITSIVVGGVLLLFYVLIIAALSFFVSMFMVPTMYLKRMRAIEAWKHAWTHVCKGHIGSAILLILMVSLLGIASSSVAVFAICATCCLALLPYVSSVILLPVTVFFVCYALCYLQQFGSEWKFFKNVCSFCNYDLRGLEDGQVCPECGK